MKHNNNILIKNCKLIDGTGKAPIENVMVLIENGIVKIRSLSPMEVKHLKNKKLLYNSNLLCNSSYS